MVNVFEIQALIKIFILGNGQVYNLLLSKRWIYRVRIIKNHRARTLTINGTDRVKKVVNSQKADFWRLSWLIPLR